MTYAPTWRRPLGISQLASGITVVVLGTLVTLVGTLFGAFRYGDAASVVAPTVVVAGIGVVAIVVGGIFLGLSDDPTVIRF